MYTDGYICNTPGKFGIDLIDEDCISYISQMTGQKYHKYEYNSNTPQLFYHNIVNRKSRYRIVFYDKKSVEELAKYGVVRHKTYELHGFDFEDNRIHKNIYPYILRGILDGDGWITQNKEIKYSAHIGFVCTVSYHFAAWTLQLAEKVGFENLHLLKGHKDKNLPPDIQEKLKQMYYIRSGTKENALKLFNLYQEPLGMERKRNKIREIFRDYNGDTGLME